MTLQLTEPDHVVDQLPADFDRLMLTRRFALEQVVGRVEVLRSELRRTQGHDPVEYIPSRLKTPESIVSKARRNGIALTVPALRSQMLDLAGLRITCGFLPDLRLVRDLLVDQPDVTLVDERDYISRPKPSGYKSLHLIVSVPVHLAHGMVEDVTVEIQLRTIAMDFWASLEHRIAYRPVEHLPPHLVDSLRQAADTVTVLDGSLEQIRAAYAAGAPRTLPRAPQPRLAGTPAPHLLRKVAS